MNKNHMLRRRGVIVTLIWAIILITGTSAAYAAEVPAGVTEVKIPLVLECTSEIAGAEIAFTQSQGLAYVGFEPANGADNPMKSTSSGNTWVGFFSASNKYKPAGGNLQFGNLVFRYTGSDAEKVTIAETRLHSLTGTGSEVKSVRNNPNTIVPVTRAKATAGGTKNDPVVVQTKPSDTTKNKDAGNSKTASTKQAAANAGGASGNPAGVAQQTTATTAGTGNTDGVPTAVSDSDPAVDAPVMVPFSAPDSAQSEIKDGSTPLAEAGNANQTASMTGWIVSALLAIALAGVLVWFFVIKRRREAAAAQASAETSHVSNR